jgi:hypothetical protein
MLEGALIVESIRTGATLTGLRLAITRIARFVPGGTTSDQPDTWTLIDFVADDSDADEIASAFADVLDRPGWYADFRSDRETFVVFPGKVYRYPRGDEAGRRAAKEHGRALGIPEPQLDWTV